MADISLEALTTVKVYSASTYLQNDRQAPSSVTIITAEQIRMFGYRTLANVLRSVRGFYVSYDRNYSYLGVRGFSSPGDYNTKILVLINGHRLTDNVYDSALLGTEFQLDVDLIDRVEIVRGPSSSLYGTNAFFAVVNVITKTARMVRGVELSAEAAGLGSYRGRATFGDVAHGLDMMFSGTIYESAGASRLFFPAFTDPSTNNGVAEHADDDSSKSFFGNVRFRHFTLEAVASTREKGIPTASYGSVFNDPRTRTIDARGYVDLKYERTFEKDLEFMAKVFFDRVEYHGTYVNPSPTPGSPDVLNEDFGRGDWVGVESKVTKPLWRRHKITVGGVVQDNLRQDQSNYDVQPFSIYLNDTRSSKEWAAYVQDDFSITKALTLNAGIRHDHDETFVGISNPRVALIYSPWKKTTFKLIYGRGFRAPNCYEMDYDGYGAKANPHLLPERIQTTEMVWEQDLGSHVRVTADGFTNRITDLITQGTDPDSGALMFQNFGRANSRGLELELAARTKAGIEGRASYTWQRTRDAATALLLPNSPEHLAKMNVIWPVARLHFSVGGELQYTSQRTTLANTTVGGYTVANLTLLSKEFGGGFQLSGSMYNLFNRRYSDPVGAEIAQPAIEQNGREFRIKLTRVIRSR